MGFRPRTTGVSVAVILAMGVPLASASAAGAAPVYNGSDILTTYNTEITATAKSKTFHLGVTDPEGDAITVTPASGTFPHGSFTVTGTDLVVTPSSTDTFSDSVELSLSDGTSTTKKTVKLAMAHNSVPTGTDITGKSTGVGTALEIPLNGTDAESGSTGLTYAKTGTLVGGTVDIAGSKATFTPEANFTGTASFQYTVTDPQGGVSNPIKVSIEVTKGSTVTLAAPGTATVGKKKTLSATVAKTPASASESLTGKVTFFASNGATGANLLETELGVGTRGANSDTWTLADTTKIPGDTKQIVARYSGDSVFADNKDASDITVAKADAKSVEVTAPANARAGQLVDVSAVVTAADNVPAPTGKVQFTWTPNGGSAKDLGSPVTATNGTYATKLAVASAATGKFGAKYLGDTNTAASAAPELATTSTTVVPGSSTLAVSVPAGDQEVGKTIKLTANLGPASQFPDGKDSGTVQFLDNGARISAGSGTADPNKVEVVRVGDRVTATFDYTVTTAGAHKITASYTGNADLDPFTDSTGATFQAVKALPTVGKPTIEKAGDAVTTGTVGGTIDLSVGVTASATPTGNVQFYVTSGSGGDPVAIGGPVAVIGGKATQTGVKLTAAGNRVFTAKYLGDNNVAASAMSGGTTINVTAAAETTVSNVTVADDKGVAISGTSVAAGTPLQLQAKLDPSDGLSASDVVAFYDGDPRANTSKKLGTGAVDVKTGVATMNYTFDAVTTTDHKLYASFDGNSNQGKGISASAKTLGVTAATASLTLVGSSAGVGSPVELTATVDTKGADAAGIKVQFKNETTGATIGDPVALSGNKATFKTPAITTAGTYKFSASIEAGDNVVKSATPATTDVKVASASSEQKLEAVVADSGKVTLKSTVTGPAGVPTDGAVKFYSDSKLVGTADVTKGVATVSGLDLGAGTHMLTATYSSTGDLSDSVAWGKVVVKVTPKVTVTAPEGVTAGKAASFAVKVSADAASKPFDGTVNLMVGTKVVGSGKVAADGTGVVSATFGEAGTQNVVAAFEGNDTLTTADSAAVTVTVAAAPTTPPTTDPSTPVTKDAAVSAPVISGKAAVGQKLTGKVASHTEGTTLTYQWLRNGAAIPGATSASYTLTAADYGKKVSLGVKASGDGFKPAQAASSAVTVGAGTIVVSGGPSLAGATVKAGYTLKLNRGTWTPAPSFTYQWLRDGKLVKSGVTSYKLGAADRGHTIRVRVIGKKAGYTTATKYTNTTPKVK